MTRRFTLERGRWYACELIGDEFSDAFGTDQCSYSPIKIFDISPAQTGDRTFRLHFFHANYPEGVQNKEYTMRMIERGTNMLLARSLEHTPTRFLQIYEITSEWVSIHFPSMSPDRDIQAWLDRNA